jgi:hypothetical protein
LKESQVTGKQQLRWGVLVVYAAASAEALMAFDQAQAVAWTVWAAALALASTVVHVWNRRRPGK